MRTIVCTAALIALAATMATGKTMPVTYQTTAAQQADDDLDAGCGYEITIPEPDRPVRVAWVVFDRGRDMLRYYGDPELQSFAARHGWAMVYAFHCPARSFTAPGQKGDINPDPARGQGHALLAALSQFGDLAHHPELASAKLILLGFSGPGVMVARFSEYAPDRIAAIIAANPGHFDPFGIETIALSPEGAQVPQLVIAGSQDSVSGVERPYAYFRRHFDRGAPWTFILQNQVPHCCVENVKPLIVEWLDAVANRSVRPEGNGTMFGFVSKGSSDTVDCTEPFPPARPVWCRGGHDTWNNPNWSASAAAVQSRGTAPVGMIPAGWMPTRHFAEQWKRFVSEQSHPIASLP